jgi:hypothetical protein
MLRPLSNKDTTTETQGTKQLLCFFIFLQIPEVATIEKWAQTLWSNLLDGYAQPLIGLPMCHSIILNY